jgi:hypothetical protein
MATSFCFGAPAIVLIGAVCAAACSGSTSALPTSGDAGDAGNAGSSSGSGSGTSGGSSGGSGSGTNSGSGGSVTMDVACADLASSLCNKFQSCAPFLVSYLWGDIGTCVAREKLACPALFGAAGAGITVDRAEACAPAFMLATCEEVLANKTPSACAFHGSVPAGGPCAVDAQCSDSAYCDLSGGQKCGVCAARLAAGGTCTADGNCQRGLVCAKSSTSTTGSCAEPGGQGAACDSTHPCLATLGCTSAGVCGAYLGAGAPCTTGACDSLHGLYCNPATHVCGQIQLESAGNPCGYSMTDGSYAICAASGRCALATGSKTNGTCEATAADGQACDAMRGPPCLAPANCATGTCALPSANCR